jgi:uncharacterized membrane protein
VVRVLLVIHIVSVIAWFGGGLAAVFLQSRMVGAGGSSAVAFLQANEAMGKAYFPVAAILTLLSGIGLVLTSDEAYSFGSGFVMLGILIFLISAIGNSTYAGRRDAVAMAAFESGDDAGGKAAVASKSWFITAELILLALTVIAMIYRWGA